MISLSRLRAHRHKLSNFGNSIQGKYAWATGERILDIQCGSFDNQLNFLLSTLHDRQLNKSTTNPGTHMYEKHISVMFLGKPVLSAARLSAIPLAAIMIHCGAISDGKNEPIDIWVDCRVIENYPYYLYIVYESLRVIKEIGKQGGERTRVGFVKGGSSVGAALIAL
ncbi:hypothetical protein QWA68_016250, partial [Fusarium oxysporum]